MWRMIIVHQYDEILLQLITHPSNLPINIDLYEMITPLIRNALGIYFQTNYYVAKHDSLKQFGITNVFYPRFMYDLISMFGLNLFYIELPNLEFLIRKVYQAISFRQDGKVKLLSLNCITPAFTEEDYQKAVDQSKTTQNYIIPDANKDDDLEFNVVSDLLAVGKQALEQKLKIRQQKKIFLKTLTNQKLKQKEFYFPLSNGVKQDPVKALINLKKQQKPEQQIDQELTETPQYNEDQNVNVGSKIVDSQDSIDSSDKPNRNHTLKIYEHIQQFSTVDFDDTLDIDEKIKKQQIHEGVMKKLNNRPDQIKLSKFLKYESINQKSHAYNQSTKTDKMFRELNAIQYRPRNGEPLQKIQVSINHEEQSYNMYAPLIELQKDERIISFQQSQEVQKISNINSTHQQKNNPMLLDKTREGQNRGQRWTPISKLAEVKRKKLSKFAIDAPLQSMDQSDRDNSSQGSIKKTTKYDPSHKPDFKNLKIEGYSSQLPNIKANQLQVTTHKNNRYEEIFNKMVNRKYEKSYQKPTVIQSMREMRNQGSFSQRTEKKEQVWIHDITMGDFQFQNWRQIQRNQKQHLTIL